ncbi:hypothetical protein PF005_g14531 [Phytophthora fragariae]|uniref:HTH CENPB-type domain-containing protein n=1 Tax=Phytophthora fragariae TaxID=53985 RepID=A0A6A3YLG5_9STRA|nr:hypothetical protein PF003_g37052 [Phytophthora fragariae]KAE8934142.1 hypothetical protein PF009_g15877 [Phytophthora fragariae]KAE9002030.1 hypothetical protein PF011_g13488 [Phytophthora fragariae]KAE9102067.1 hypothetical protein PF007_g14888 [Phytophthora fragariae]KAE9113846.1 hypothetical protein PF010_g9924 [Phytophthora fragariae]
MPSEPQPKHSKWTYIRLTLGQKAMLCKRARDQPGKLEALQEWATQEFDLPRPLSSRTLQGILNAESKFLNLPEAAYTHKQLADPETDAFDQVLLVELHRMEKNISKIIDKALMYRSKLFFEAHFTHLPADKRPGFSKGWAHRFRKRHGIRKHDKERK